MPAFRHQNTPFSEAEFKNSLQRGLLSPARNVSRCGFQRACVRLPNEVLKPPCLASTVFLFRQRKSFWWTRHQPSNDKQLSYFSGKKNLTHVDRIINNVCPVNCKVTNVLKILKEIIQSFYCEATRSFYAAFCILSAGIRSTGHLATTVARVGSLQKAANDRKCF